LRHAELGNGADNLYGVVQVGPVLPVGPKENVCS
jgi:hypothetical protein